MSYKTVAILATALLVGAYVPLAFGQSGSVFDSKESIISKSITSVSRERAYTTLGRRDFQKAMEIYREYVRQGMRDLVRPTVSDWRTVEIYLNNPLEPARDHTDRVQQRPASPKGYLHAEEEFFSERELSEQQRAALQRSVKTGRCWHYPEFPAGFAALCRKMIRGTTELNTSGLQNDIQALKERHAIERQETVDQYKKMQDRIRARKTKRDAPSLKTYVQ